MGHRKYVPSKLKYHPQPQLQFHPIKQPSTRQPARGLDAQALQALMGGPSDADLMKESMAAIQSPEISIPNKLVAFDNLEQLIEQIDNANNMQNLGLWDPLLAVLESDESDLRRMAAWCMGTAVQNNVLAQERVNFPSFPLTIEFQIRKH